MKKLAWECSRASTALEENARSLVRTLSRPPLLAVKTPPETPALDLGTADQASAQTKLLPNSGETKNGYSNYAQRTGDFMCQKW